MKTVFTDISQVAHLWANQLQDNAKNSGHNFYFSGDTIYSYGSHFPIAKHVENEAGVKAVLFTERSYSNTTAKHISVVQSAASHKNIIYCSRPDATHGDNFKYWQNEAERTAKMLLNARKPEKYLNELGYIKSKADTYSAFYGINMPEVLAAVLNIGNKAEYAQFADQKDAYEKAEQIAAQKELEKRHKKELAKWLKGEGHRLYVHNGFDYLRVIDERIETTQAVKIPFELGKRLYNQIKANTLTVGAKVMDYEVLEVGKNVKIGCHNFKTDYLLKFGQSVFN